MSVQTKVNQAIAELERLGYVGQNHIDGITALIQSDQRISVATAIRRYTEANPIDSATNTHQSNSGNAHQSEAGNIVEEIADRTVREITNAAWNLAMQRIASGDWGDLKPETRQNLENFKTYIKTDLKVIDVNFSNAALPTSQQNLLPSSEEIFDNAVIGNITQ